MKWPTSRQQTANDRPPPDPTVVVGDDDLAVCASVLRGMEDAFLSRSDAGIRSSAGAIARAGGVRPPGDLLKWVMEETLRDPEAKPLDRPWYWLAAVAVAARECDDLQLAGRIGFFMHGWSENIAPMMGLADQLDCGGLMHAPRDAYAEGLGCAVGALAAVEPGEIIVSTADKVVPAGPLLAALAPALLQLDQAGVPVDSGARSVALRFV
jgi:hypothetical protein